MNMTQTMQNLSSMKTSLLFDIESTGLLRQGSRIHCIVVRDSNDRSTQVFDHRPDQTIIQGVKQLQAADVLIGHNIIGYDIPLLKEQFPDFAPSGQCIDTLVLSRLFYPHLSERDYERRPIGMPQRLYGSHGLEAWGYRLKCFKGDYGKHEGSWAVYTPEMLDYCIQDTEVTLKLWELMKRRMEDYK